MPDENVTLVANFELIPPETYTLTLNSNPVAGGTVIGEGEYHKDEEVTIFAIPNDGFVFLNWTFDGTVISPLASYSFTMPGEDLSLVANFEDKGEPGDMVRVRGGTFLMGNTLNDHESWDNENPVHTVHLRYDYWLGKFKVTFEEYDAFCNAAGISKPLDYGWGRERQPVINVSWWDAIAYCNWLSEQDELAPAYDSNGNLLNRSGEITEDISQVEGYRLPTEAEWEYAARGGHVDITNGVEANDYKYAGSNNINEVAWYMDNFNASESFQIAQPVGEKKPNELGLYDMSGNLWEWCYDFYASYTSDTKTDPIGPSVGSYRVRRGGSWFSIPHACTVASRFYASPNHTYHGCLGFRISRTHF